MNSVIDLLKELARMISKGGGLIVVTIGLSVWLTVWIGIRVRDVELSLNQKFHALEKQNEFTWTVQMMAARDKITAEWNPTNRIPDSWRIFYDVKAGREPTGIRIGP